MSIQTPLKTVYLLSAFILLGALMNNPLKAQDNSLKWRLFEEAFEIENKEQKPILVDVWAPWCGWCKKMQRDVYPQLSTTLSDNFVLTRLNRDDNESKMNFQNISLTPLRLAQKMNVQEVPAVLFLSPEGEYLFHITGFIESDKLIEVLEYVSASKYK